MSQFDSTIRLRQLNEPEVSGYVVQIIQAYLTGYTPTGTGVSTGLYYPLNSNPSGYVTSGQTGIFKTQSDLDNLYNQTVTYVFDNYYAKNNPSGFVTKSLAVIRTGNQTVSGIKTFTDQTNFSGAINVKNLTQITDILGLAGSISVGNVSNNSKLLLTFDGSYDASIYAIDDSYNYYPLNLKGSEIFLNQFDGGNVGINTPSLFYALDVNGTIGNSNGNLIIGSTNNPSPNGNGIQIIAGEAQSYPATQEGGNILINAGNDLNAGNGPGSITLNAGDANAFNGGNVNLNAGDSSDDYLEARIGGNVILTAGSAPSGNGSIQLLNGNVGIGTNSPQYLLDVTGLIGNSTAPAYVDFGYSDPLDSNVKRPTFFWGDSDYFSYGDGEILIRNGKNFSFRDNLNNYQASFYADSTDGLYLYVNNQFIIESQLVGIATSENAAPVYTLDVYGTIGTSNINGGGSYLNFNDSTADQYGKTPTLKFNVLNSIIFDAGQDAGYGDIILNTSSSPNRRVGVGNDSPAYTLDVNGTIGNSSDDLTLTAAYQYFTQGTNGLGVKISGSNGSNGNTIIHGGNGGNIVISAGLPGTAYAGNGLAGTIQLLKGNVGILTTSPVYTLDVSGSGNFSNGLYINGISVLTGSTSSFITTGQTGVFATTGNLALTGSNLQNQINSLSGQVVYTTGNQTISGNKTFTGISYFKSGSFFSSLTVSGVSVLTGVATGSFVTTGQTGSFITTSQTGVFVTTGQTGSFITTSQTGIFGNATGLNGFSGSYYLNYGNMTGSIVGTGSFITNGQTGIFITTGQTGAFYPVSNPSGYITGFNSGLYIQTGQTGVFVTTGQTGNFATIQYVTGISGALYQQIQNAAAGVSQLNSLSGSLNLVGVSGISVYTSETNNIIFSGNSSLATTANLQSTGSNLQGQISSLSGTLTSNYALITNLVSTGSNLQGQITSLSGSLNTTGSNLQSQINSLSGQVVYTTGNQNISGIKSFLTGMVISGSLSQGFNNSANGLYSHSEGAGTFSAGTGTHSEGTGTYASGNFSHAEGWLAISSGAYSHAEGYNTFSVGLASHAEGSQSYAIGIASHAEGSGTTTLGQNSHAEGTNTHANGYSSHAEGNNTFALSNNSHSEGVSSVASGLSSHAEGDTTTANGNASHAEGISTIANGNASHAEGGYNFANGEESHAEGDSNYAVGFASHAEGTLTYANGSYSHAEGSSTTANGDNSHSEGYGTNTYKDDSHAEGYSTIASGTYSHAEGFYTRTVGDGSHAEGAWTIASGVYQHVGGKYNIPDFTSLLIIGNGTGTGARSNILTINPTGLNVYGSGSFSSGLYVNGFLDINGSGNFRSGLYVSGYSVVTGAVLRPNDTGVLTGVFYPRYSNPSGYITGVDLSNYVTSTQTGTLTGVFYPISNPSGYVGTAGLSGYVTTGQTGIFVTTSQTGIFVTTGQTGVFSTSANLVSTGSNLQGQISSLSGTLTGNYATSGFGASTYATITNLASTGSNLQGQISSLSGTLTGNYVLISTSTGISGSLSSSIALTGSNLQGQINSLSGTLTGNYVLTSTATGISGALTTSIASTGSNLQGQINSLSGKVIFTTGSQTISGVGINSILSVLAPSGLTGDYYNALDSGRNSVFRVGPITNGTRLALFPSGNPTAWGKLSIEPDPAYAAGWATFLGVSTNGNGGRIYLCGLDTAGAPTQGFTALNLSYVKTVESFPSKLSMQANDNGLGYNSASVSAIAGGVGDLVLAVGSAGGFITNAQINTNNTASLSFKSYNNTGQQYVAQHPEAYTFDTAYNVPSLGGLQHTRWKVSGSNIMSLNPSGRLGIRTDSPNYQLEVIGSGNFASGLYISGFSVLTGEPFAISLSGLFSTGNQTGTLAISGTKTFTGVVNFNSATFVNRPTVNGTGVLLSGEASAATVSNVVYTTGNTTQTISGSLTVTGHFSANTKSFLIDHPTQVGRKLQYGSLESPYHGVRLTGKGKIKNGICQVELPEYIKGLVHQEEVNIQITNINHDKILYVKWIDINNNNFIIGCNNDFNNNEYEFYWSFTAVRKDVEYLKVEI